MKGYVISLVVKFIMRIMLWVNGIDKVRVSLEGYKLPSILDSVKDLKGVDVYEIKGPKALSFANKLLNGGSKEGKWAGVFNTFGINDNHRYAIIMLNSSEGKYQMSTLVHELVHYAQHKNGGTFDDKMVSEEISRISNQYGRLFTPEYFYKDIEIEARYHQYAFEDMNGLEEAGRI